MRQGSWTFRIFNQLKQIIKVLFSKTGSFKSKKKSSKDVFKSTIVKSVSLKLDVNFWNDPNSKTETYEFIYNYASTTVVFFLKIFYLCFSLPLLQEKIGSGHQDTCSNNRCWAAFLSAILSVFWCFWSLFNGIDDTIRVHVFNSDFMEVDHCLV